jgi:hypothetical protein
LGHEKTWQDSNQTEKKQFHASSDGLSMEDASRESVPVKVYYASIFVKDWLASHLKGMAVALDEVSIRYKRQGKQAKAGSLWARAGPRLCICLCPS